MRVAIVDPASWSLAYDVPLGEALARAGCDVTLHCTKFAHGPMPTSEQPRFAIDRSFYRPGYQLLPRLMPRRMARAVQHPRDVLRLARSLRDAADVVMVQWLPGRRLDANVWAKLAQDVPVLFTMHNAQERDAARSSRLTAAQLQGFTAVVVHSDGGERAVRELGADEVWRMRIGAYEQYAGLPDPDELPVSLPSDAPLVLFAGLLRRYKGIDVLLEAWPRVHDAVPEARLVVAGRPMDVVLPPSAPDGATFLPRFTTEQELGWLLRRAEVLCAPYLQIDMSGIVASAVACGTPMVLSDVGGFDEYVGRGAELVPPGDADALAATLVALLRDPRRRAQLAAEAQVAAREHYSWDAIAAEYVRRFSDLVAGA